MEIAFTLTRLDATGATNAARDLFKLPAADSYVIDFGPLEWVEPFGMLFFASRLRAFREQRRPARFRATNYDHHGYAAHMGFFQSFGLRFGNDPGEAPANLRYIPITAVSIPQLEKEAALKHQDVLLTVEERSQELAAVLTRGDRGELHSTLSYSLREIMRNVVEHSRSDTLWYAAQYWPGKEHVELTVLDEGVGIQASLRRNPHLRIGNDLDALRFALLPGISGVAYKGGPRLRKDEWANSGYGLFMTSQLCAAGGSFLICSGETGLLLNGSSEIVLDIYCPGTVLRLDIYAPDVRDLSGRLEELRQRGGRIAGELRQAANLTASMSSRMLSKDFSGKQKKGSF